MTPVEPSVLVTEVRRGIADLGDPAKAPQMQAYMKSDLPYRGVTAVPLRGYLKEIYARLTLADEDAWQEALLRLWEDVTYREEWYAAIALARHRSYAEHRQPHTLDLYRHLLVTGAWWDVVDEVATHLVRDLLERFPGATTPVVRAWRDDESLWLRRSAIICQVGRKNAVDRSLLTVAIDANLEGSAYGKEFFVRKAIGWALRDHARTDPAWVRTFLAERGDRLSGLSRREASRHL